jgi:hypothetical protein
MKRDLAWMGVVLSLVVASCGPGAAKPASVDAGVDAGPGPGLVRLRGAVEKGPFVIGTTVSVSVLDATGRPTGSVLTTTTIDDLGSFGIDAPATAPLRFEAMGGYYNEATGTLSGSPLTLRAYYLPDGSGAASAYINAITHLTARRIERLTAEGASFAGALEQSEYELRQTLALVPEALTLTRRATETTLAGADDLDNAYLFAVSAVFAIAAQQRTPASPDVGLQELLNAAAIDLEDDGAIGPGLTRYTNEARDTIDTGTVERALAARLSLLGRTDPVPDLDSVLDRDADGIVNRDDNCPRIANPDQSDADSDGYGDVCATCGIGDGVTPDPCWTRCDAMTGTGCRAEEVCVAGQFMGGDGVCSSTCEPVDGCRRAGTSCQPLAGTWTCLPDRDTRPCDFIRTPGDGGAVCPPGEVCVAAYLRFVGDPMIPPSGLSPCLHWCRLGEAADCDGITTPDGRPTRCLDRFGASLSQVLGLDMGADLSPYAGRGLCLPTISCTAESFLRCDGDTAIRCASDGFAEVTEACMHGCAPPSTSAGFAGGCLPPCSEGTSLCLTPTVSAVCSGGRFVPGPGCPPEAPVCGRDGRCRVSDCRVDSTIPPTCVDGDTERYCAPLPGTTLGALVDRDCAPAGTACTTNNGCECTDGARRCAPDNVPDRFEVVERCLGTRWQTETVCLAATTCREAGGTAECAPR